MEDIRLEISKLIGEPINPQLPRPVEIEAIADVDTANPGEKVFYFASQDTDPDEIYYVNTASGKIVEVKRDPLSDTALTFQGLNSREEYVLVDSVLNSPDIDVLGRKKEAITRGMDKLEVKLILDAIIALGGVATITPTSAEDIYDVIMRAKHALEDYGDGYVLLAGSSVKEAIDTYDKDNVATFNYNVDLLGKLAKMGIKVVKIFGQVKTGDAAANEADSGTLSALLDANKFILVAVNSRIAKGKPLHFVRRKISPEIAKLMGADVDSAQRALIVANTPVNLAGVNTLGYGVYGYESVIWAIKNVKAMVKTADLSAIL